jgi:hypothetical protein
MTIKNKQSKRLTDQHKKTQGVDGIFGDDAIIHESSVDNTTSYVLKKIKEEYPLFTFRYRKSVSIYTKGNGDKWNNIEMLDIMLEVSKTSLEILSIDL